MKTATKTPTTREVILSLLKEDTGRALGDSGDHYGRNHELNQKKAESELMDDGCKWELPYMNDERFAMVADNNSRYASDMYAVRNTGAVMAEQLEYTERCHELNQQFMAQYKYSDSYWLADIQDFLENIGAEIGHSDNTYNGSYALSQCLQYTMFNLNGTEYVFVQVHGGCDIRGGYTHPVIFEQSGDFYHFSPYPFGSLEATNEPVDQDAKDWIIEMGEKKALELQEKMRELANNPEHREWQMESLQRKHNNIPRMQCDDVEERIFLTCCNEGHIEQIDNADEIAYDAEREMFFVPSQKNPVYYKLSS